MKKLLCAILASALLAGCTAATAGTTEPTQTAAPVQTEGVPIVLSDNGIQFPENAGVHVANDIIYYEAGHDESYGEGEAHEAHTAEEAAEHTVIHITRPGTYVLSGTLPLGQIAVDLGENAKDDPSAVVTLVLDGLDITCRVAPAIIFYNVYECGDAEDPRADVDTSAAGANVVLAPGSENRVVGSHVAKIFKPGTDKKLHKYDAAFYSRMSMNVGGEGKLHIYADNEGLDSELHLTINAGEIYIESGNDGINTNEDGVSVTTVNGGKLWIAVTGSTGEGDGIDSNGWLVINGGHVEAYACAISGDAGIDADLGIEINGGTVIATGNMLDRIDDGGQTHAVFTFAETQKGFYYTLKDQYASTVLEGQTPNAFTNLILSSPMMTEGTYTLWSGETQFEGMAQGGGFFGGMQPIERPEWPGSGGDVEIPPQPTVPVEVQGVQPPQGEQPENMPVPPMPQGSEDMPAPSIPEGGTDMPMPQPPAGVSEFGRQPATVIPADGVISQEFPIKPGANYFYMVRPVE